jgi:hypothetical protein
VDDDESVLDAHDSMLAVATARLTSAGGSGMLSLWSFHRPFMPLSVVEGHEEGAVADFVWLQTPQLRPKTKKQPNLKPPEFNMSSRSDPRRSRKAQVPPSHDETIVIRSSGRGDTESILFDNKEKDEDKSDPSESSIWQHILSIGRDGRCILQSLTRGESAI